MCQHHHVSLGFTEGVHPAGVHVCHLYSTDEERDHVRAHFLARGVQDGELSACVVEAAQVEALRDALDAAGVAVDTADGLSVLEAEAFYFGGARFRPEVMLAGLRDFHDRALREGRPAARVIGEMSERVCHTSGGERLTEYESAVNALSASHPVTAICQYDTRRFSGETILEVLEVHPKMIRNGMIIENPFYLTPEQFDQRRAMTA